MCLSIKNTGLKIEIDVYDKQMTFKRRKEISLKNIDYETVEVYKAGEHIYHFYTVKENKMNYLTVQQYNLDIEKKGDALVLDSTSLKLGVNYSEFKIARAKTGAYILIYKYEFSGGRIDKLFTMVMDGESKIIQKNEINLSDDNFSPVLIKRTY